MTSPMVSVVVTAYDVAPYLARCLRSVLAQSERSLEVIVVDDASTDASAQIADAIAAQDSRVRVIRADHAGVSTARNHGLRAATGQFVCFVDGDDWVEPTMVSSMVACATETASEVVVAGAFVDIHDVRDRLLASERRVPPRLRIERAGTSPQVSVDEPLLNLLGYAWNKLYRRDWLRESGIEFDDGLDLIEDLIFNVAALSTADRVAFLPEAFAHYIQRPRPSLGTRADDAFLGKRLRAVDAADRLLALWGVDARTREQRRARAGGTALWLALRRADVADDSRGRLRAMLEHPSAERLLGRRIWRAPIGWRGRWAAAALGRRWYGLALLPMRIEQMVRRTKRLRERAFASPEGSRK